MACRSCGKTGTRYDPGVPPIDGIFPLFQYGGVRYRRTASAADRAVLVELRRSLAVIWGFGGLRWMLPHEVAHVVRGQESEPEPWDVLAAMVSEGLATFFADAYW